jgi:hypothetical protein
MKILESESVTTEIITYPKPCNYNREQPSHCYKWVTDVPKPWLKEELRYTQRVEDNPHCD